MLSGLGAGVADQQVVTLADSAGNLSDAAAFVALPISGPLFEVNQAGVSSAITILTQDCKLYQSVLLSFSGTWVGTIQFEASNDNTNWFACNLTNISSAQGSSIQSVTFNGIFYGNVHARYFRARVSAYTSGTVVTVAEFSAQSATYHAAGTSLSNMSGSATLADSFANPSVGHLAADQMLYNGSSWDRVRNNFSTTTGDTGAKTFVGATNGATQTNMNAAGVSVVLNVGTVSGTTPTLVAKLQGSADGGTTWFDIPGAATASLTATGVYVLTCYPGAAAAANAVVSFPLPRTWRVVYTIGGTTPSFTLTNVQVAYTL